MALHGLHGVHIPMFRLSDSLDSAVTPILKLIRFTGTILIESTTITWKMILLQTSLLIMLFEYFFTPYTFMQNAVMLFLLFLFYWPIILSSVFWGMLLNPFLFFFPLMYVVFVFFDRNTPKRGGRPSKWFRKWGLYKYFRDYFPIRIIKTADLDPTKNYMFGYHPHGVACLGIRCFIMEAMKFRDLFPGLESFILTIDRHFNWPVYRDFLMATGFCSVSKESIAYLLSHGTGNALINVIGGVAEVQEAHPGSTTLALANRKGFVKICLQHGASLVPVYAFGENDILSVLNGPDGSFLRILLRFLSFILGYFPILSFGRGLLPYKTPINVVVGAPIHLPKILVPTVQQIQQTYDLYIEKLNELFEAHKGTYGYGGPHLNIV